MSLKDILVIALDADNDAPAFALAEQLSAAHGAVASATLLTALPEEPLAYEPTVVSGVWAELLARARSDAQAQRVLVEQRLAAKTPAWTLAVDEALARDVGRVAAVHARYADLAILTRPNDTGEGAMRFELIEGVLFHSGRPALVVPPNWSGPVFGKHAMIAWDASREATRALAEARTFLARCDQATVVTVDAKPKAFGHGERPGLNIAGHLSRRGVKVEVRNIDAMGRSVAEALIEEARVIGADLMVMGAYAHSRLREMVFGGATRDLLQSAETPLLMAH